MSQTQSAQLRHGTTSRLFVGQWVNGRITDARIFWRHVHDRGVLVGSDEGGSSYRVDDDLYVLAHTGTYYYQFVVPYHYAGVAKF